MMEDLNGKGAFVTGGASGIGLGMARAFAANRMKIAIADVEAGPLAAAEEDPDAEPPPAEGMVAPRSVGPPDPPPLATPAFTLAAAAARRAETLLHSWMLKYARRMPYAVVRRPSTAAVSACVGRRDSGSTPAGTHHGILNMKSLQHAQQMM